MTRPTRKPTVVSTKEGAFRVRTPEKPIIIVGTGRCGSTMFQRVLARHKDVGWLSTFNEVFPSQLWLSIFSNLYGTPLPIRIKHLPFFPKPFEAYDFWKHYLPEFKRRDRPLTADDVPAEAIEPIRHAVREILRFQRRTRFLAKVTGWSRMPYFDRLFPDALFVHIRREHRAVISSKLQRGWHVTNAFGTDRWPWGEVRPEYERAWRELGGGPLLSAAVKAQLDLDDIAKGFEEFPDRSYELRYEDLISRPLDTLRAVTDFCELRWDADWEDEIRSIDFFDTRDNWKKHLSAEEGERVLEFFARVERGKSAPVGTALDTRKLAQSALGDRM